ncbi:hypothetical protein [Magnetospira thiophila]
MGGKHLLFSSPTHTILILKIKEAVVVVGGWNAVDHWSQRFYPHGYSGAGISVREGADLLQQNLLKPTTDREIIAIPKL